MVKVTVYDENTHAKQVPVGYAPAEAETLILLAQYNNNPYVREFRKSLFYQYLRIFVIVRFWSAAEGLREISDLAGKRRSLSYNMLNAYAAIVFVR